jgi:signal transduction histidine kinase
MNSELDRDSIEISVIDSGIGIRQEDIPKLFKDIAQLEPPYTKKFSGAGVGLLLTRKLVELLGGEIGVESEPGTGSVFRVVIPLRAGSAAGPRIESAA